MQFEKETFAARLRSKRAELDMTQVELSDVTGLSSALISQYENSEIAPGAANIIVLSRALDCDPNYLLGWGDN